MITRLEQPVYSVNNCSYCAVNFETDKKKSIDPGESHLQIMTCNQEYASFNGLPPGLRPRRVICGGVLLQVKGWGHSFGETNSGADAETLSLCTVGRCHSLNPGVVVKLSKEARRDTR